MKHINYKTNKPLFLGILANTLNLTIMHMEIFNTEPGLLLRGMLAAFSIVAITTGLTKMNGETRICQWKKKLFTGLRGK